MPCDERAIYVLIKYFSLPKSFVEVSVPKTVWKHVSCLSSHVIQISSASKLLKLSQPLRACKR